MVSRSMSQVGKWSRRIGGGVLVLVLAGLSAPATTSAAGGIKDEVIVIEDEAPWTPQTDGYIEPVPSIPSNSGVDSEGGSESGGGLFNGGGYVPSGGGTKPPVGSVTQKRLANLKNRCVGARKGTWGQITFKDFETGTALDGYFCEYKVSDCNVWPCVNYDYYDSDGLYNKTCTGTGDDLVCSKG